MLNVLMDMLLHMDVYLGAIIQEYGIWTYAILFLIIFLETGVVITPFLPGDSLLFAAGAFAAIGSLDIAILFIIFAIAAIGGDTANYWIGNRLGTNAFTKNIRFLKKEYLRRAETFYEKHGAKTIVIARFLPVVRTFAPFVAGIGKMDYLRFLSYNVMGGLLWISIFLFAGYFFGSLAFVKENFSLIIIFIILLSFVPPAFEYFRNRHKKL